MTGPDPDAEARSLEARLDAVVLDTSALMAVLLGEPEGEACAAVLGSDARLLISGGTLAEALVVAGNRGIGAEMAALVGEGGVEVVPVTASTAARAAGLRPLGQGPPPGWSQPGRLLRLRARS